MQLQPKKRKTKSSWEKNKVLGIFGDSQKPIDVSVKNIPLGIAFECDTRGHLARAWGRGAVVGREGEGEGWMGQV